MNKKIVILGGSFNPPTKAHFKLLQSAIDQITTGAADETVKGIFVPSSGAYVSRKMRRKPAGTDKTVLSEKLRFDMLWSFHELDQRLSADGRELGTKTVKGHTMQTLLAIQQENPGAQVYFIFGGDKLQGLTRWDTYEALVSQFKVIVFERDGLEPEHVIRRNRALAAHSDAFVILRTPEGLDGISSTAVRERLQSGERAGDMLTPEVYAMLLGEKGMDPDVLCMEEGETLSGTQADH